MARPHQWAWDLRPIANRFHREVVWSALGACDFPFRRIRRRTGRRVPCSVSDLSRFAQARGAHSHVHDEDGNEGHMLGDESRAASLGLYWLPTADHPAGRVELEQKVMGDTALAQEVFLAEAAHAVQYGAMTPEQRTEVAALFEHIHQGHEHAGEFEEAGEQDYFAWKGERWMGLFMAAFAPSLPRPLESRQPWHHSYDAADIARVRSLLL